MKTFSEGFIGDTLLIALLHSNAQRQLVLGAYQFLSIFDSAVAHGPQWSDICFSMVVISTWTEEGQVLSIQHGRTTPAETAGNSCATLNEKISSLKVGAIVLGAKMGFEFKGVMVSETFCQYSTVQTVACRPNKRLSLNYNPCNKEAEFLCLKCFTPILEFKQRATRVSEDFCKVRVSRG